MLNGIVLIHRRGPDGFNFDPAHWFPWQTCLRKIAFGSADALDSIDIRTDDEVLSGLDAYRFCLEVICGLHSPLIGETEVFGQFKNAADSWCLPHQPWGNEMRRFLRQAFADAKKIRATYLAELGSQSYGSLLRRELKSIPVVHMLGGGHLVGEILPWLCKDGTKVYVHVRDLTRVSTLRREFPQVEFRQLDQRLDQQRQSVDDAHAALVVAAPVTAAWLTGWISQSRLRFTRIADLRGDAETDPMVTGRVVGLGELMRRIADNQELLQKRRSLALAEIEKLVLAHGRHIEYRPFGWEDVCA